MSTDDTDPAAPLEKYLAAIDRFWRPREEVDAVVLAPGFAAAPIAVGDLRKAAEEIRVLRQRLDLVIDKARAVPSAEPGEGDVGMLICLEWREWHYIRGDATR